MSWRCVLIVGLSVWVLNVLALKATEVYQKISSSVFPVYGFDGKTGQRVASATSIAVSKDLLATNCHIALGSDQIKSK